MGWRVDILMARLLVEAGAVLRGEFRLSSGGVSNVYVDARILLSRREWMARALSLLYAHAHRHIDEADAVVGVATGGIPWATGLGLIAGKPVGYVRAKAKEYGAGRILEGWRGPGRAVLVDDVSTSGGSLATAVEALRSEGVEVETAVVLLDREEGAGERLAGLDVVLAPVTRLSTVLSVLGEGLRVGEGT